MLPTTNRLKKDAEFKKTIARGRRFYSTFFIIYFSPNQKQEAKIGIVVSNKVSKKATTRNRLRRFVKSDFLKIIDKLNKGNYVVILKVHATSATHQSLSTDLNRLIFERVNAKKDRKN